MLMQTDLLQRRAIALKPSAQPPQGCRAIGLKLLRLPLNTIDWKSDWAGHRCRPPGGGEELNSSGDFKV